MEITVLGPGCAKCHEAERVVREAVAESGVAATVVKVSDLRQMARMGVFSTPAVVVDGQVKCAGKVPTRTEVAAWIAG